MKIMRIESKLICITCVHTECALTAILIECAFSQTTSIGGLKPVSTELQRLHYRPVIYYVHQFNCAISKSSRIKQKKQYLWLEQPKDKYFGERTAPISAR